MADTVTETVTVESEQVTASSVVWRRFQRQMPGLIERVFDDNPGLADQGEELALGTSIAIPVDTPAATTRLPAIKLW